MQRAATGRLEFSRSGAEEGGESGFVGPPLARRMAIAQLADPILEMPPQAVIVDDKLDIVQFRGRTGPYLDPAPGAATLNVLTLARPELLFALRTTMHKALSSALPATSPPVSLSRVAPRRLVSVDVLPLPDTDGSKCLLVLFNEVALEAASADSAAVSARPGEKEQRVLELERELAANNDYLQYTVEELEAANEEDDPAGRAMQSSNEEAQARQQATVDQAGNT